MVYEGTTTCFPLEVKWSGDEEAHYFLDNVIAE